MDLKELYSLRNNFTIIGLTGKTGSGCSKIAEILSSDFSKLKSGLRQESDFTDPIFRRKYTICKNFLEYENNWIPFDVIKYTDVLLFFILHKYGGDQKNIIKLFSDNYIDNTSTKNKESIKAVLKDVFRIDKKNSQLIKKIKDLGEFNKIKSKKKLLELEDLFYGDKYKKLKNDFFRVFEKHGYFQTRLLLHWTSCNIRKTGDPLTKEPGNISNIYSIAKLINILIKAKREANNGKKPTKIVIDSLRNSLELMFFKERYAAFYMVATKDVLDNSKSRIEKRLKDKKFNKTEIDRVTNLILKLDAIECKTKDFEKGEFSSPDVENCIQKSDYHIYNLKKENLDLFIKNFLDDNDGFYTREEQILKLISLIQQPGIITPSPTERIMQIAHTAELNSGCVSRRVGAVITDNSFYVKAVGWNDVAKGQTPCNLRNINDFIKSNEIDNCCHYSNFEKGIVTENSSYKYKSDEINNFKSAVNNYYQSSIYAHEKSLKGRNSTFCFKTIHNFYEGEVNQVHTKSLHAEENAMLQIVKNGGLGINGGFLFTTASPCELCSKKAYQIGIKRIYYIDPYPGISKDQIINCGDSQPLLIPFSGAIGNVYHKLYELFISQKDEISMILEIDNGQNLSKKVRNVLSEKKHSEIIEYIKTYAITDEEMIALLKLGIENHTKNRLS